jgi:hypothetical protein
MTDSGAGRLWSPFRGGKTHLASGRIAAMSGKPYGERDWSLVPATVTVLAVPGAASSPHQRSSRAAVPTLLE